MLTCPDCNRSLITKKVRTHSGAKIEIDQCPYCHGVWFDHFEANQVPFSEIKKLASQGTQKTPDQLLGEGKCPHCLVKLVPLRSESVPQHLNVFVCPQCQGNWFSQKNLLEFKTAQKSKIDYFKKWRIPLPSAFAVLLPLFILTILTLSIPVTVINLQKQRQQELRIRAEQVIIKPTVINLNPTSVIITWATTQEVFSEIKYWSKALEPKTITVAKKPTANHTIELKNLQPNSQYFYQLLLKDQQGREISSQLYSFTTK